MISATQTTSPFQGYQGGRNSKVVGFEQGGDEKHGDVSVVAQGGVKELAQGGSWTLVKSPRKVKEDRKRERDYDEEFPVLVNTYNSKYMDHKVGEVSVVAQGGVKELAQRGDFQGYQGGCMSKVVGFEQRGYEKFDEVSVVAQGGNWTLVKSPRKIKEDKKRERDYDEEFPLLVNANNTKYRVHKVSEVSLVAQGGVKELVQGGNWTLVKSPRKVKEDRKRERDYDEEFPVLVNTNNSKYMDHKVGEVSLGAQGGVKELAQGGSWTLVKSPRKIKENRKSQSNNCVPGARHQERGFLRYKGGDESEIGQGADVNVLLLEERNDVSVPVNNEPDQVFAPRMQNRNNNCFANTCLSILGNTPEGLAQIKIFINKEHQNSQDIELGKLMKDAVHSSSIKKPINLCKLIPLIDSSLQLGEQEDIYPFISNLSEKLGFGEGTIFPKTEKIVSSCEKCGEESITLNPTSIVTLFFMNGKNVLDEFRTGLQQNVDKMCYTCGENTNHKQIQILEKSDYLMLRSLNDYSEKEVDLIKEIENIGSLSLVGFATRKADATGNSGHWWYTRVMHDGTSVKLDGEKLHHQNNIITSRSLSDGNLFVYKILPTDASFSLNPPTTVCVDFPKVVGFEDVGYKKVCVSYQNEGNEKIIDIVHGKSIVSGLDSVVLIVKRITCVLSGCVSTFSRNDVMLRHLREKHKMQRDDPNYPGNQSIVFVDKGKDGGDVGPDPKPTQGQDTVGEGGEVGAEVQDTEGVDMEVGGNSELAQDKDTEEIGYKKVCVSYQNEGNEKIFDIVHGKSIVSGLDSVVLTVKRITCVVSGCVSTFLRNDVMLRHLRENHKMQRDDPNYPGNQSILFVDKGKDSGDVGPDPKPTQGQDTLGEGGEVGAQILDTEGVDMEVGSESEPAQDQHIDVECSELSDSEPEPYKKKKKRSQRQRSALHIENYSSDDSEEETSCEFSNEFSLSKASCLEGLIGEDADDFENMGYSGNAEDLFVQNSLQEDTLGNYENSICLEEDVGMSVRKSISQVFDSSIFDNGLVKLNENFDEDCDFDLDKSEHSLIQDSMEGGLGVEESKSDSDPSEKLELLKQKLKSISDEIKRIEKEKKRKNDGKSMIIKAEKSKIDKLSKKNDIKKSYKKPGVVLVSVSCSYCDKAFSSVFNLKRHIVSIHNIAEATVRELNFEATSKKCLHCGKWQKNLAKHVKICSKKKELDDKIEARAVLRTAILADGGVKSHVKGGILFMERIEEWYEHHSKQTRSMYLRKIKNILHYWEENIPNFIASKLLYPLEYNISLPTLDSYLKTETDSVKATSMKAYMQICDFVNDNLRNRYSADENYSPLIVSTWANEVLSFKHAMSGKLKSVNRKASLNTILNKKASREKYGDSDLKQNAVRCKVLYRILNQHSGIQEELKGIIKMSPCKLATDWDEPNLRSFLVGLLIVSGGGARPHVVTRMTVQEFQKPFTGPKGNKVVHVHNHKTVSKFGPAPLIFIFPRLYDACSAYQECFRSKATSEDLLFGSARGTEMKPIIATEYIQNNFLKNELTENEKRNFTPKIWRQAWTNWTRELTDPELRDIGNFTMGHSEAVVSSNYIDLAGPNALKFGNTILSDALRSDNCFPHEQEQCESLKILDPPEKLCEQSDKVQHQGKARISGKKEECRVGAAFSEKERLIIRKAFCDRNDHPPKSFTESMIQKQIKVNPNFRQVYESLKAKKSEKLKKSENWTTSSLSTKVKIQCRNTIRKCINARHKPTKLSGNFDTFLKRPMKVKSVSKQNESDSETYSDESAESSA